MLLATHLQWGLPSRTPGLPFEETKCLFGLLEAAALSDGTSGSFGSVANMSVDVLVSKSLQNTVPIGVTRSRLSH